MAAVSAYLLAVGHLLSTSTFDLLAWTALSWLVARALRAGGRSLVAGGRGRRDRRGEQAAGRLPAGGLAGGLLWRSACALRSPWPWLARPIAVALWAPYLAWQATHGWPQLQLSSAIASGSSGTSEPAGCSCRSRWCSSVRCWPRSGRQGCGGWPAIPRCVSFRAFAVAYVLLALIFLVTGGKPYYLAGLYPALLAAGAEPTLRWAGAAPRVCARDCSSARWHSAPRCRRSIPAPGSSPAARGYSDRRHQLRRRRDRWLARFRADDRAGSTTACRPRNAPAPSCSPATTGRRARSTAYRAELACREFTAGITTYYLWGPPPETSGTTIVIGYNAGPIAAAGSARWNWRRPDRQRRRSGQRRAGHAGLGLPSSRLAPWAQLWPELRRYG